MNSTAIFEVSLEIFEVLLHDITANTCSISMVISKCRQSGDVSINDLYIIDTGECEADYILEVFCLFSFSYLNSMTSLVTFRIVYRVY